MKRTLFVLIAGLVCAASLAWGQSGETPLDYTINSATFPVFSLNAIPIAGANISLVGNPGPATWCYWASANYQIGNVFSRLGCISNAPNILTSSNYVSVIPFAYPPGVVTVDILATTSNVPPTGACNCAVATGLTSGGANQQSNTLSSYTISIVNPSTFNLVMRNEVVGSGSAHLLLRNAVTNALICDLSIACGSGGGSVTNFSSGNLSTLFTTSVATPTTSPVLSFSPSAAAAGTVLGNNTGSSGPYLFVTNPQVTSLSLTGATLTIPPVGSGGLAFTPSSGTNTFLQTANSNVLQFCDNGATLTGADCLQMGPNSTGAGILWTGNNGSTIALDNSGLISPGIQYKTTGTHNFLAGSTPIASIASTGFKLPQITGSTQCLHVDATGLVSGTAADCGGGAVGPGTVNTFPIFTASNAIGNSALKQTGSGSNSQIQIINAPATGSSPSQSLFIQNQTGSTCFVGTTALPLISFSNAQGCSGTLSSTAQTSTAAIGGTAAGFFDNEFATSTSQALQMGSYSESGNQSFAGSVTTTNIGAYNRAEATSTAATSNNYGTYAFADNALQVASPATLAENDAIVAQTGNNSAGNGNTTNDVGVHVLSPSITSTPTLTNHYGILVEDQTTGGGTINPNPVAIKTVGTAPTVLGSLASAGTNCVHASTTGQLSVTSADCGSGSGSVTSVGSGTGLTGGPITTTGSLSLSPFSTNGTNNAAAGVNFLTSTTNSVGLTVTPSNPSTNGEKIEVAGTYSGSGASIQSATIPNGALVNSSITLNGTANQITSPGSTALGATATYALANPLTTPGAATIGGTLTTNVTGGGIQCGQVNNAGVFSGTGSACGSGAVTAANLNQVTIYTNNGTTVGGFADSIVRPNVVSPGVAYAGTGCSLTFTNGSATVSYSGCSVAWSAQQVGTILAYTGATPNYRTSVLSTTGSTITVGAPFPGATVSGTSAFTDTGNDFGGIMQATELNFAGKATVDASGLATSTQSGSTYTMTLNPFSNLPNQGLNGETKLPTGTITTTRPIVLPWNERLTGQGHAQPFIQPDATNYPAQTYFANNVTSTTFASSSANATITDTSQTFNIVVSAAACVTGTSYGILTLASVPSSGAYEGGWIAVYNVTNWAGANGGAWPVAAISGTAVLIQFNATCVAPSLGTNPSADFVTGNILSGSETIAGAGTLTSTQGSGDQAKLTTVTASTGTPFASSMVGNCTIGSTGVGPYTIAGFSSTTVIYVVAASNPWASATSGWSIKCFVTGEIVSTSPTNANQITLNTKSQTTITSGTSFNYNIAPPGLISFLKGSTGQNGGGDQGTSITNLSVTGLGIAGFSGVSFDNAQEKGGTFNLNVSNYTVYGVNCQWQCFHNGRWNTANVLAANNSSVVPNGAGLIIAGALETAGGPWGIDSWTFTGSPATGPVQYAALEISGSNTVFNSVHAEDFLWTARVGQYSSTVGTTLLGLQPGIFAYGGVLLANTGNRINVNISGAMSSNGFNNPNGNVVIEDDNISATCGTGTSFLLDGTTLVPGLGFYTLSTDSGVTTRISSDAAVATCLPSVGFQGSTSGNAVIGVAAVAGTPAQLNLPTATPSATGQFLNETATSPTQLAWDALLTDSGTLLSYTGGSGISSTGGVTTGASPPVISPGTSGAFGCAEGTNATNAAGAALIDCNSTTHEFAAFTNGSTSAGMLVRAQPGPIRSTGLTASVGTATLCAAAAGACNVAGTYHVHVALYQSGTACTTNTTGGVSVQLTWTDANGSSHSAVTLPLITNSSLIALTGTMLFNQTGSGIATVFGSGDLNIDTNGSVIQYATTYANCSVTGTATYAFSAVATRLQ